MANYLMTFQENEKIGKEKFDNKGYNIEFESFVDGINKIIKSNSMPRNGFDIKKCFQIISEYKNVKKGIDRVSVKFGSYVGSIQLVNGKTLEILPKISLARKTDDSRENPPELDADASKKILLDMISCMDDNFAELSQGTCYDAVHYGMLDAFINLYLRKTARLAKKGLKSGYVRRENNLKYYKGKLLVRRQIQKNMFHPERFFMSYETFEQNRPENRIIKSTLDLIRGEIHTPQNYSLMAKLISIFSAIEPSRNVDADLAMINICRENREYETVIELSRIFLHKQKLSIFSGNGKVTALLFPMELVYERYVARYVKIVFGDRWKVNIQPTRKWLSTDNPSTFYDSFDMRPDIVLEPMDGNNLPRLIMDTKWKKLDPEAKHNGIQAQDMYQMAAYSRCFGGADVWLLYPCVEEESLNKSRICYQYLKYNNISKLNISIHFVDLGNIKTNLQELKSKILPEKD